MANAATLAVLITGKNESGPAFNSLNKDMDHAESKTGRLSGVLGGIGKAAMIGVAVGATAVVGLGAAALKLGSDFDSAYDTIRIGTGATGDALKGLEGDFKSVIKDVPTDFGTASQVIADLNTRTGQTGVGLQNLTKNILEMSRITETDANTNVRTATRLFGDWSIATENQAETLDKVFRASQATGIGVDDLMGKVVQFGAPLRQMGFSFEESIAMLGKWEKEGVNAELVLGSLRIAAGKFAKEGIDLKQGFAATVTTIRDTKDETKALAMAMDIFGARAGPDMAAAIREGRFAIDDYMAAIEKGGDTIMGVADETADFGEKWQKTMNRVAVAVEPVAMAAMDAANAFMDVLAPAIEGAADAVSPFVQSMSAVLPTVQMVLGGFGALAQGIGGILSSIFRSVISIGRSIYQALQWLNPFAKHSPSLVDEVERGVEVILAAYGNLGGASVSVDAVRAAIGGMGGEVDVMAAAVEASQGTLDAMRDRVGLLGDALNNAKDALRRFSDTPLEGSGEFQERAQVIEDAMDRVRLQMVNMRLGGADSEALKPLQEELDNLRSQAEKVDLEERLQLGPLRRQLKDMAQDKIPELGFDAIASGITDAKAAIGTLAPALATEQAAFEDREKILKIQEVLLREVTSAQQEAAAAAKEAASSISEAGSSIGSSISGIGDSIGDVGLDLGDMPASITAAIDDTKAALNEGKAALSGVSDTATQTRDNIEQALAPIGSFLDRWLITPLKDVDEAFKHLDTSNVTAGLTGAFNDLAPTGERVGQALTNIGDAIGKFVPVPLVDMVQDIINAAAEARIFEGALGTLTDAVNIGSGAIADLTRFLEDNKVVQAILVGIVSAAATAWGLATAASIAHTVVTKATAIATGLMTTAQWLLNAALTANPIGIVITALGFLAGALIYAYQTSDDFRRIVDGAFSAVGGAMETLGTAFSTGEEVILGVWNGIELGIQGAINGIIGAINGLLSAWNSLSITLPRIAIPDWVPVIGGGVWGGNTINTPDVGLLPYVAMVRGGSSGVTYRGAFEDGGIVPGALGEPGFALVHGGERITPAGQVPAPIVVHVHVAGSVIAERDLAATIQAELTKYGRRNVAVGLL